MTSWAGKGAFAFLARFDLYWFIVVIQLHSLTVGTVIMLDYAIKMQRQNDSKVEGGKQGGGTLRGKWEERVRYAEKQWAINRLKAPSIKAESSERDSRRGERERETGCERAWVIERKHDWRTVAARAFSLIMIISLSASSCNRSIMRHSESKTHREWEGDGTTSCGAYHTSPHAVEQFANSTFRQHVAQHLIKTILK